MRGAPARELELDRAPSAKVRAQAREQRTRPGRESDMMRAGPGAERATRATDAPPASAPRRADARPS